MKIFLKYLVLVFVLFSANSFADTNSNVANELTQLLKQYETYKASFKQLTYYNSRQKPEVIVGTLYMKRPGKFRWQVEKPMKQVVIANGNILWIYDVELQQVTQQHLDKNKSNNPAVLLSGNVMELIKQYDVTKKLIKGETWFQLKPLSTQSSFLLIRMRFVNHQLTAIWLKNNLGQVSLFEFSNIQLNTSLHSSLFNFKPPPGVDVLK